MGYIVHVGDPVFKGLQRVMTSRLGIRRDWPDFDLLFDHGMLIRAVRTFPSDEFVAVHEALSNAFGRPLGFPDVSRC